MCGLWQVFQAPVNGSSPMHVWTELTGYSELRGRDRETETETDRESKGERDRDRQREQRRERQRQREWNWEEVISHRSEKIEEREMYKYAQNSLSAYMELMKKKI